MSIPFRPAKLADGTFASGSVLLTRDGLTLSLATEDTRSVSAGAETRAEASSREVELPWQALAGVAVRHAKLRPRLEIRLEVRAPEGSPWVGTARVHLPIARSWAPDANLLARRANASIAEARARVAPRTQTEES